MDSADGSAPLKVATIKLGQHELAVVPQKHARLKHGAKRLGFNSVEDYFVALAVPAGAAERYDLLNLAIPDLEQKIPRWEWDGYGSAEAAERDDYQESGDRSPDYDQIVAAGHKVIEVNGVGRLGKIVGLLQTMTSLTQQESGESENSTHTSPVLPGSTGE
jgi:hypothetical protein